MKRILFDTNIILDVLLDRKPHIEASAAAWAAVETGRIEGLLAAHTVTTIHYLVQKERGAAKAKHVLGSILRVFQIAAVDGAVIQEALELPFGDFEDAVVAAAAGSARCHFIVTRDPKGFRRSYVPAVTAEALMPLIWQDR